MEGMVYVWMYFVLRYISCGYDEYWLRVCGEHHLSHPAFFLLTLALAHVGVIYLEISGGFFWGFLLLIMRPDGDPFLVSCWSLLRGFFWSFSLP